MSPAHALRAAGRDDNWIEAFYQALRAADPTDAKAMIDNPTEWTP